MNEGVKWPMLVSVIAILAGLACFGSISLHFAMSHVRSMAQVSIPSPELVQATSEIVNHTDPVRIIAPKTITSEVPKVGKFVAADLDSMELYLYKDGALVNQYPILSKGRPDSQWETPTGSYKVKAKGEALYSSLGKVYMPYSMQFYGNFLIHGWPYYPDGTPVPKGYSGGCIRLSTEDAKKVYQFVSVSTPVFVYENPSLSKKQVGQKLVQKNITVPNISAKAFLIADLDTGEVYGEKSGDQVLPIASVTKLMTAIVANESMGSERKIQISRSAVETSGDSAGLKQGEVFLLRNILYPLLMVSSNDAATAIAEAYGRPQFISAMDEKAIALGMKKTSFADPSGISADNVSTVNDLYLLASYLHQKKQFLLDISRTPQKKVESNIEARTLYNFNVFSGEESFLGGKTGFTNSAKETFLSLFEVPVGDSSHAIAFIVLGSDDRKKDVGVLLEWMKNQVNSKVAVLQ